MHHQLSCLAATLLPRDRFIACGGHDVEWALATVKIFDLCSGRWGENVDYMPTARLGLAAASVGDRAYTIGGYPDGTAVGSDKHALRCVEVWNDNNRRWSKIAPTKCGRTGPGAVALSLSP